MPKLTKETGKHLKPSEKFSGGGAEHNYSHIVVLKKLGRETVSVVNIDFN